MSIVANRREDAALPCPNGAVFRRPLRRDRHPLLRMRPAAATLDPTQGVDSGSTLGGLPASVAEVVQVEEAPALGAEEEQALAVESSQFAQKISLTTLGLARSRVTASWSPQNTALLESRSERR
jgi:hypothetical protein